MKTLTATLEGKPDQPVPRWVEPKHIVIRIMVVLLIAHLRIKHKNQVESTILRTFCSKKKGFFYRDSHHVPMCQVVNEEDVCMSVVTLEIFRWMVVGVVGFMLATFVALNLREHIMSRGQRWVYIVASIFLLQLVVVVALKANVGTRTEEGQYEKIWETKESKLNTSDNNGDENSRGPFNQVVKVAIIIGFGLIVILTKQRKRRDGGLRGLFTSVAPRVGRTSLSIGIVVSFYEVVKYVLYLRYPTS
ncbi:hypothetical protein JHK87_001117 [Glycine soja]|nr:hypothetical protein JHK87_001117 [Glycine soja]